MSARFSIVHLYNKTEQYKPNKQFYCGRTITDIINDNETSDYNLVPEDIELNRVCKDCANTPEGQMKLLATVKL